MAMLRRPAPNLVATTVLLAGIALCLATMSWRTTVDGPWGKAVALAATTAGLLLVVAGTTAHTQRPANRVGLLLALTGCAVFAEDLAPAHHSLLHTAGLILLSASTPLLMHAVLAFPRGRLESLPARLIVGAAYVATFGGSIAKAVVDGSAPIDLAHNLLLWRNDPELFQIFNLIQTSAIGVLAFLAWLIAVLRAARAQHGDRPVMVLLATGATAGSALSVTLAILDHQSPIKALFLTLFYGVLMIWSAALMAFLARFADGLMIVTVLARRIIPRQSLGITEDLLRDSLHDPSLRLGVLDESIGTHFDHTGAPLPPASPPALARQDYGSVAACYWDNGFMPPRLVLAALSVVDAAQAADRAASDVHEDLRRNLHDGAQQRLTALALRLRMLETGAIEGAPATWAQTRQEVELANAELRRLARGEAPEALDRGLAAALRGFAARSPVPLTVSIHGVDDLPEHLAACAYFVVAEGVTNAIRHGNAQLIRVSCHVTDGTLSIEVMDDGTGGAHIVPGGGLAGLVTRVAKLGGTLSVTETGPTQLWVRLPLE